MRLHCARTARLIWIALVVLAVVGCQSNAERDLIARDRRMQEDQMWAMQDYIQQYQQLVCRFRSENASLRRQLNDERSGVAVERELAVPRVPASPPTTNGAPTREDSAPGIERRQVPSPNVEMPDVPPLGQGSSIDSRSRHQTIAANEIAPVERERNAQFASYETPVASADAPAADKPVAHDPSNIDPPADSTPRDAATTAASPDILLSGEVVANDSGGGPRLVIDLESFDQSGRVARFDGSVSLALLSSEGGVQHRLARWDFGPDDVRSAVDTNAGEPAMRFQVELPAGAKVDGPTELWAKLAPADGARLFSRAKVNLTRPGVFSSRTDKVWASEESVEEASYAETSTRSIESAPTINEGTWATAKPGKPAILPPESDESTGGWKAASGPLSTVVESTKPPAGMRNQRPKPCEAALIKPAPVEVARKPSWMPERPGAQAKTARPSWSATR